jgi:hypothetical protein
MTTNERRPNRSIPEPEHLGEETVRDAAIGGSSDDEYEPIVPADIEEIGAQDDPSNDLS